MNNENSVISEKEALKKLANICAKAEHCSYELCEKLYRWGVDSDAQERIIQQLKDLRYIDEERYTKAFVNDKIAYNKWGRRKIEQALYQKRVDSAIYNKVLDEVSEQQYLDILQPLLRQKLKTIKGKNDYERSMKLIKYALSRGFEMHLIRQCIDNASNLIDD